MINMATAKDIRELAKQQNETFQPRGPVPRISEFPNVKATLLLCCMDPRVQPHEFWNLNEQRPFGVVRNAGGRAQEFLKSAEVLTAIMANGRQPLGTVVVVHHTDCGMLNFSNEYIRNKIKSRSPHLTAEEISDLDQKDFGEFADVDESVREDIEIIRKDPFLPKDLEVIGFVYDSFTGKTYEVV